MPDITHKFVDGTVLAVDGDTVLKGTPRKVGWDNTDRSVTETGDGRLEVTWYADGEIVAQGTYERGHLVDSGKTKTIINSDGVEEEVPIMERVGFFPEDDDKHKPDAVTKRVIRTYIDRDGVQQEYEVAPTVYDWQEIDR